MIELSGKNTALLRLFNAVRTNGGRALFVGGCVRDALLGHSTKDFDIEVYGLDATALESLLHREKFRFSPAGKSFGVFKLHEIPADIALPRRESKLGRGHKGFLVEGDPKMSLKDAAARRDFTVNSIYFDPLANEIIDPFNGRRDLALKLLRHTSPAFPEDPLRVLRAMQFAARFRFNVAPETVELCKTILPEGLSAERIFDEWSKLITRGEEPSRGLRFLRNCGWIRLFPELAALIDVPQDPAWHPEGDVWNHTLAALDTFARERSAVNDDFENLVVGFAVLCHDFGKPATTRFSQKDRRWHAFGHDREGVAPTKRFLERMTNFRELIDGVLPLVACHMQPIAIWRADASDSAVRRLARRVGRIDRLLRVCSADTMGRASDANSDLRNASAWLRSRANALRVHDSAPKPLVLGRHLLALGIPAGPAFSPILHACYEAQLDGKFSDSAGGIAFAKKLLAHKSNSAPATDPDPSDENGAPATDPANPTDSARTDTSD